MSEEFCSYLRKSNWMNLPFGLASMTFNFIVATEK